LKTIKNMTVYGTELYRQAATNRSIELHILKSSLIYSFYAHILNMPWTYSDDYIIKVRDIVTLPYSIYKFHKNGTCTRLIEGSENSYSFIVKDKFPKSTIGYRMYMSIKTILKYRIANTVGEVAKLEYKRMYDVFDKRCKFVVGPDMYHVIKYYLSKVDGFDSDTLLPDVEDLNIYEKACIDYKGIPVKVESASLYGQLGLNQDDIDENLRTQRLEQQKKTLDVSFNTVNNEQPKVVEDDVIVSNDIVKLNVTVEDVVKSRSYKAMLWIGDECVREYPEKNNRDEALRIVSQDIAKMKIVVHEIYQK